MDAFTLSASLGGLGSFFGYFATAIALLLLFLLVYGRVTPYPEFALIREGKVAPAISFTGAMLGFVVPVASAITHSVAFADMVIWAVIALAVQICVFLAVRSLFPALCREIANDHIAAAILLGGTSLAVGILNAACMSY